LLFWFVSDDLYNAEQLVADADGYIKKATERGMPSEDIEAIQMAFMHLYASSTRGFWIDSDTLNQQSISFGGPIVEVDASS
jgi:hypothetical protein